MPATKEAVDYISTARNHVVLVEPPVEVFDQHGGKRVADKGYRVRFNNGRATVPAEWVERFESCPAYTGDGTVKRVFRADEALDVNPAAGPRVLSGALGAPGATERPPTESWDSAPVVDLARGIRAGKVKDLDAALRYEMAHRRRKTVVRALTEMMLGDEPADDAPPSRGGGVAPQHITAPPGALDALGDEADGDD